MSQPPNSSWQSIVITGGSSGIGLALGLKLAAPGVRLVITGRDQARLDDAEAQLSALGAEVIAKIIDVRDRDAMQDWLVSLDQERTIDLLIANAGVSNATSGTNALGDLQALPDIFDINVTGVINTLVPLIKPMRARKSGQLVIMGSIAGFRAMPYAPAYSASKVAVVSLGEALRGRLEGDKVKVNTVTPGFVRSRITDVNKFPMPFFKEADQAADIIIRGLNRNKSIVAFPWPMVLLARIQALIPSGLYLWLHRMNPLGK